MHTEASPSARDAPAAGRRGLVRAQAALLALALVLNLGLLALAHLPDTKRLVGDERRYFETALALARGIAVEQDPLWPALPARAQAAVVRLLGESVLPIQLVQIALWLAAAVAFGLVAQALLPSPRAALAAQALFVLSPELMAFSHYLWPVVPCLAFFLIALALLVRGTGPASALAAGGSFGVALLFKLALLPFAPVAVLFAGLSGRPRPARSWLRAGLFAGALCIAVLPAGLANLRQHGRFMIADSTSFNLWVGLLDETRVDYADRVAAREYVRFRDAGPDFASRERATREKIRARIGERGALATLADQLCKQPFRLLGFETYFTTQLVGGPREAYASRSATLAAALRGWAHLWHALLLLAGCLGLAFLDWRRPGWLHAMALWLVLGAGVFVGLHATTRYLLPLLPSLALFGGAAVSVGAARRAGALDPGGALPDAPLRFTRARALGGVFVALAVEWIAFRNAL